MVNACLPLNCNFYEIIFYVGQKMKIVQTIAVAGCFLFLTVLIGCDSSEKKIEDAENDIKDAKTEIAIAKQELNQAQKDSVADYAKFRMETEARINNNEKSILIIKNRIISDKKALDAKSQEEINDLEKKNNSLKKTVAELKVTTKEEWEKFKVDFNNEVDKVEKSVKKITTVKK